MSKEEKCLRCGGTNLEDGEFQSTGKIYTRPKSANLASLLTTGVVVDTVLCYDCGHVELVVNAEKAKSLVGRSRQSNAIGSKTRNRRSEDHERDGLSKELSLL